MKGLTTQAQSSALVSSQRWACSSLTLASRPASIQRLILVLSSCEMRTATSTRSSVSAIHTTLPWAKCLSSSVHGRRAVSRLTLLRSSISFSGLVCMGLLDSEWLDVRDRTTPPCYPIAGPFANIPHQRGPETNQIGAAGVPY